MGELKLKPNSIVKIFIPALEWVAAIFSIYYCTLRGFGDLPNTWLFNVAADLICMFINLFFIMGILFRKASSGRKYSLFLLICHANFTSLFLDFFSWMADGFVSFRVIMVIINTGLYISNLCLTTAYAHFIYEMIVTDAEKKKKYLIVTYVLFGITIITRLLNIKYGYFFTISEETVYSRGPYQFLSYIFTILVQFFTIYILIKGNVSKAQKKAVLAFTIIPFTASIVSIFIYGLSLMYACVLISIVMIYSAFFVELEEDRNKIIETFEKFISNDIVQKIVDNPSGKLIEGRRYTATVLVSDIRGFTALSETMNPQDLVTMLNHYFGEITDVISSFGGVVTEFLGDGIMCIFGAPKENSEHADSAIAAALTIQKKSSEINQWNKEHGFSEIRTGIGINTGTMVLGSLGNEKKAKYTAVGQSIDRAFDIEDCSLGGQVLISASALRSVKADIKTEFLEDYMPNPDEFTKIKIYEVLGIGGKWNITSDRVIAEPVALEIPEEGEFCVLDGKHVNASMEPCIITALSDDAVRFSCKAPLEKLDNIKLNSRLFGKTYAKVIGNENNIITAVFTAKLR